jgi:hypothetical protein
MSTAWNVYCKTCKSEHSFDDANRCEDLMWLLIDYATEISKLVTLFRDDRSYELKFSSRYGDINTEWFAKHCNHELIPISEYGDFGIRQE